MLIKVFLVFYLNMKSDEFAKTFCQFYSKLDSSHTVIIKKLFYVYFQMRKQIISTHRKSQEDHLSLNVVLNCSWCALLYWACPLMISSVYVDLPEFLWYFANNTVERHPTIVTNMRIILMCARPLSFAAFTWVTGNWSGTWAAESYLILLYLWTKNLSSLVSWFS